MRAAARWPFLLLSHKAGSIYLHRGLSRLGWKDLIFSLPEGTGGPMRDLLIAVVIMSSIALAIAVGVGFLLG